MEGMTPDRWWYAKLAADGLVRVRQRDGSLWWIFAADAARRIAAGECVAAPVLEGSGNATA